MPAAAITPTRARERRAGLGKSEGGCFASLGMTRVAGSVRVAHQASSSSGSAKTLPRDLCAWRWTGRPSSFSQRCTVRTRRLKWAAISFHDSRRRVLTLEHTIAGGRSCACASRRHEATRAARRDPAGRFARTGHHERVLGQEDRSEQPAEAGDELSEAAAAELARDHDRERHGGSPGNGGDAPQRGEGAAQQERELRVNRDERRTVDVSPIEMPPEIEEIQLVAEVAVAAGRRQVERELHADAEDQNPGVERRDPPRRRFRGVVHGAARNSPTRRFSALTAATFGGPFGRGLNGRPPDRRGSPPRLAARSDYPQKPTTRRMRPSGARSYTFVPRPRGEPSGPCAVHPAIAVPCACRTSPSRRRVIPGM